MTVATGNVTRIPESYDTLQEIDATGAEIVNAIPEVDQQRLIEWYDRDGGNYSGPSAEKADNLADELPEEVLDDWETWIHEAIRPGRGEVVMYVLEAREDVYIHTNAVDYEIVMNLGEPPVDPDQLMV
ncbi:hypothetical protein [Halorubrum sp. Atlit-26R]|uniref:hypothetical protein n=1 Tax=Halorubrum sp. Atlit-26R TaxID=2282128 RepID=UPI000EF26275|nr:hypothetical protein [Halorubrum sp. Atlit-26R]RLM68488.1 hypothetical protein DVK07_10210 [Halorubrum sp. Atlit-26R]